MALTRISLDLVESAEHLNARVRPTSQDPRKAIRRLSDYLRGLAGGLSRGTLTLNVGAAKATGTLTFTDQPIEDESFTIGNVTFTAKDSGATGNQWNITAGGTAAADAAGNAASVAALINAHASLSKFLTATAALGVVTVTCDVPGDIGHALQFAAVDLTNATVSDFATEDTGDDGTETVMVAGA